MAQFGLAHHRRSRSGLSGPVRGHRHAGCLEPLDRNHPCPLSLQQDEAMPRLRATFGDALLRAHRALLKDLTKLREAAQGASTERPADLVAHLDLVRADIQEHFRFEEQNGYMASVLALQPHLERTI